MEKHLIEKYIDEFFKELKHTPGPWIALLNQNNHGETICIETQQGETLAEVYISDLENKEEMESNPNAKLISQSPEMLRTICHTYLTMLVKFAYGQNSTVNMVRISMDTTLADLRNAISTSTGIECEQVQKLFEHFAHRVSANS